MTNLCKIYTKVKPPTVSKYTRAIECVYPDLIIGAELETENCPNYGDTYQSLLAQVKFTVEGDNSLRGNAFEFISKPMQSTHFLAALEDYFKLTKFTDVNYSDRCSVHIHVNCTDMTMEQISTVSLLYTIVEDIIFEFVGNNRDTNIYCIPWNQCRNHFNLIDNFLRDSNYTLASWQKYTAVNLIPLASLGTMEFRQMHGTSDLGKLTQWVNIIGALFKYGKSHELKDLIAKVMTLNNTSQYEQFFTEVLGGQLAYSERYRQRMEEGIIFGKYTLSTYGTTPLKLSKSAPPRDDDIAAREGNTNDDWLLNQLTAPALRPNLLNPVDDQADGIRMERSIAQMREAARGLRADVAQPPPRPWTDSYFNMTTNTTRPGALGHAWTDPLAVVTMDAGIQNPQRDREERGII